MENERSEEQKQKKTERTKIVALFLFLLPLLLRVLCIQSDVRPVQFPVCLLPFLRSLPLTGNIVEKERNIET